MGLRTNQVKSFFSFRRLFLPILIGLSVSGYLLSQNLFTSVFVEVPLGKGAYVWQDINQDGFPAPSEYIAQPLGNFEKTSTYDLLIKIDWGWTSTLFITLAILTMVLRDFAYMVRLRILSDQQLSWKSAFHSIMLWETASAITPSVVGGSSIAMFILNKEGINLGKSTAIVMATALLDELFFILFVPLMFVIVGTEHLFPEYMNLTLFGQNFNSFNVFLIGYGAIVVFVIFVSWGLFLHPKGLKKFLFLVFSLGVIKKWRKTALQTGNEIVIASDEFKLKSWSYWLKSFGATTLSWISRYLTANLIIMAFVVVDDHFLIIARQLVMWVVLLISPTPGGSGIAEMIFSSFLKDSSIHELALIAAILWRLIGYYPYLFIGAILFPSWLKKVKAEKK